MIKKVWSIAALWLLLALLVFIYTDRDEYAWAFEGETLSQVLISEETAQQRESDAQAAMDREKEAARARYEAGQWGKEDPYDGAPHTRDAVDEALGLNLMWGEYDVTVAYASPEALSLRTVSALRQPFIEDGAVHMEAGEGMQTFRFTLTDSAEQVAFACDLPDGAQIHSIAVRKAGTGVFSRDLAVYALFAGAVMTVLFALSCDTRPIGRERRRDALVVCFIALFASMPLLWRGIYDGHDLFFHLNRIEGIASGLRAGQFPVRIHASTLLGYGYAAPQFYPELFLYIPAVLRNLGVSLMASVRVFELMINFAAAAVCYGSARGVFGERRIALGATALYTLCSYRLSNMYVRATLGESLAMIFFPLLLWALYEVLARDEKKWPLLALSMTGVFMSHLLSTLFVVMMCALAAIVSVRRLIREPGRILACIKAAAVMVLCSAWFLVPFLDYAQAGINTSVVIMSSKNILHLGAYMIGYFGQAMDLVYEATDFAYTIGVIPGLVITLGCALLLVQLYMRAGERAPGREDRLCRVLLALGGLLMLGATEFFPWEWACSLPRPYSTFFQQIQYPWRLVGVAAPMLAFAAAWGYMREEAHRTQALVLIAALSMVFAGYSMQAIVQDVPLLEKEDFCDTRIEQYEYTYEGTEKSALEPGEIRVIDAPEYTIRDYDKQGTTLSFTIDAPQGLASVELPLLYYPGYRATANGEACRVSMGENKVIRLYGVPGGENVQVCVWYAQEASWAAACGVSIVGAALLGVLLVRMRRRRA